MNKILSICIPTNGRINILDNTLESIFSQNINEELFEVCISDNSKTDETEVLLKLKYGEYKNLNYKKNTSDGFLNSIEALKMGKGKFLKLHNNYSCFNKEMLLNMIDFVSLHDPTDLLFFSLSTQKTHLISYYPNMNDFLYSVSYYCTWSTSFGIWKEDLEKMLDTISIDRMFPHVSILFSLLDKEKYVVNDLNYYTNQELDKKGGYNFPHTFLTVFLKLLNKLLLDSIITEKTFKKIKKNVLIFVAYNFYNQLIEPHKYTFSYTNLNLIVIKNYGFFSLAKYYICVLGLILRKRLKI